MIIQSSSLSLKDYKRNYPEVKDAKYLHEKYLVPNELIEDSPYKMLVKLSDEFNYGQQSQEDAFGFAHESNNIAPRDI